MTEKWLRVAYDELEAGVSEVPGPEHNPRIVAYHAVTRGGPSSDELPWCSSFASYCVERGGITSAQSKRSRDWLPWGIGLRHPPHGAIVVLERGRPPQPGPEILDAPGHVGFYVGPASESEILVLGGNQRNRVDISVFPRSRILGFRWPN